MANARRPDLVPAARAEARVIKDAFRQAGIHVRTEPEPDGGIAFMYRKGVLLVRDEDLDRVLQIVARPETGILLPVYPEGRFPLEPPVPESGREGSGAPGPEAAGDIGEPPAWRPQLRRVTFGVVALALLGSRYGDEDPRDDDAEPGDERAASGVLLALNEIDRQLGAGVATPNHVLTVSRSCRAWPPSRRRCPAASSRTPGPVPGSTAGESGSSWVTPGWWPARQPRTPGWPACRATRTRTRVSCHPEAARR